MEIQTTDYPGTVKNQKEALELLIKEIPNFSYEESQSLDFEGKDQWQYQGDLKRAYFCRVLAARSFERIGKNSSYEEEIKRLKEAAFSYDKAAKNARDIKFPMAALRCRIRACKIFNKLYNLTEDESYLQALEWATEHIETIAKKCSYEKLMIDLDTKIIE